MADSPALRPAHLGPARAQPRAGAGHAAGDWRREGARRGANLQAVRPPDRRAEGQNAAVAVRIGPDRSGGGAISSKTEIAAVKSSGGSLAKRHGVGRDRIASEAVVQAPDRSLSPVRHLGLPE
jgi:hypothetical protein